MKSERFEQKLAIIPAPVCRGMPPGGLRALHGWIVGLALGLVLGLAWSVVVAAPPSHPETAAEIERALSAPTAQPPLQLRGAPSPGSPGAVRLRGLGEIVSDPAPPSPQRTDPAVSPPPRTTDPVARPPHQIADPVASPPPRTIIGPVETVNYPTLIQNRPKVAALIHFDVNSARIRSDAYKLLNEYVKALNSAALADAVLVIAGHTDSTGSREYNLSLSRERARSVRDYLISRGIAPDRLIARGYGPDHPVASNATVAGRDLNRRSEFIRVDVSTTVNP
ncbi:MAG: OmpA family protein [Candidatus Competibacteraceae bacterium]